jgi:protein tyrosine/serine phosphatase
LRSNGSKGVCGLNVPRFIRRLFRQPYDGLRHFGVVAEGALYRCGQPRPEDLEGLIAQHGLRTVVSLRGSRDPHDPDAWEREERAVCEAHGVRFELLPCNHRNPPTVEQVGKFLDWCEGSDQHPVMVHCRLGQQRTMMFCALYRVHVEGMDPQAAEVWMDELGFGVQVRRHKALLEAFRKYARMPREAFRVQA